MLIEKSNPIEEIDFKHAKYENLERKALSYIFVVVLILFISNEHTKENVDLLKRKKKQIDKKLFYFDDWLCEMKHRLSGLQKEIFGW